jgi:predicted GNAT superfamily acetyltransferase
MAPSEKQIDIRECTTIDELAKCVELQREVFALPDIEISPVRHLVVTRSAGGFTLGAFIDKELIGFVLSVPAQLRGQRAYYSHMTAVKAGYQSFGVGARLKWAQRERALAEGVQYIKWTFEPVKARNAYFNLEKLGAVVREYVENYYGVDYYSVSETSERVGLASDRLFAEWKLNSTKVAALSEGNSFSEDVDPVATIAIMNDWSALVNKDPKEALQQQMRIRAEFADAFSKGLVARAFLRASDDVPPMYLLYDEK